MLYSEIISICSQIHTKHISTLCGQNVEFVVLNLAVHTVTYKATHMYRPSHLRYKHAVFSGDISVINLKMRTAVFRLFCRLIVLA